MFHVGFVVIFPFQRAAQQIIVPDRLQLRFLKVVLLVKVVYNQNGFAGPAAQPNRSAAALSPKKRGRLPAERHGGIHCLGVGSAPFNDICSELAKIIGGVCRAARPAQPPNQRMNLSLLWYNRQRLCGREGQVLSIVRPLDSQGRLAQPLAA